MYWKITDTSVTIQERVWKQTDATLNNNTLFTKGHLLLLFYLYKDWEKLLELKNNIKPISLNCFQSSLSQKSKAENKVDRKVKKILA